MKDKKTGNTIHYLCMIALLLSWLTFSHGADTFVYADDSADEEATEQENEDSSEDSNDKEENSADESEHDDKSADNNDADEDSTDGSKTKEEKESDENEEEDKDQEAAEVDSEGFIIHSEKVEGEMDLAGALVGKVNIEEGTIEGLTITKEIDTGDERDPMVIQITSPGPVNVD